MKTARSYKIISLLTMLVISLVFAICGFQMIAPKAAGVNASTYFMYNIGDRPGTEIAFSTDNKAVVIPLANAEKAKVVNKLSVDDFEIQLKVPASAEKFTLTFTASSFDVNGNEFVEGTETSYKKSIENKLVINADGTVSLNGASGTLSSVPTDGVYTIQASVANNLLNAVVTDDNESVNLATVGDEYKLANNDKTIAVIEFELGYAVDVTTASNLEIYYIDQKATDANENYKQSFETQVVNNDLQFVDDEVYPVVALNDGFMKTEAGKIVATAGKENNLTVNQYAVVSANKSFALTSTNDNVWVGNGSNYIVFNQDIEGVDQGCSFSVVDKDDTTKVYETYDVVVRSEKQDGNGEAPKYINNDAAIKAFENELQDAIVEKYDEDGNPIYVRIGSTEYVTIPSLKNMVSDNLSSYENLTYTLYYKTPTGEQQTTGLRIPIATAGKYTFYVLLTDEMGNAMNVNDFIKTDSEGETSDGIYAKYVFSFEILDNAPVSVTAAASQGDGFIGVQYAAKGFTIKASAYDVTYKLMYSADKNAEESAWVEIPKAENLTDTEYSENGFSYNDVQNIAYDGNLSFKPDRAGYYKIVCTVVSKTSSRVSETAESSIISIQSKPTVVVAAENDWLLNNVWSVVFLAVGGACLIAIVVLLFIKPKEEVETKVPRERTRKRK